MVSEKERLPTRPPTKNEGLSPAEEKVFGFIVPAHESSAIKMSDFKELYGEDQVKRDRESIERKKTKFMREETGPTKRAKILEALLSEQIELSDWFGSGAFTIVSSEYDDLYNGVDLAIEFERESSYRYMAVGVDVTSSGTSVAKKLSIIKEHIRTGTLTRMKYFSSERNNFWGEYRQIPQIVVGVDSKTIEELSELWLTAHGTRLQKDNTFLSDASKEHQKKIAKEAHEKLANHRVRILLLKEVRLQLQAFLSFAWEQKREDVALKFESLLLLINDLLKEGENVLTEEDKMRNESDSVFQSLKETLEHFDRLL